MRRDPVLTTIEEATDLPALDRLRPEWEALWRAVPEATPFQSPAWLIPWWRHVGEGALLVLALRAAGRLVRSPSTATSGRRAASGGSSR